MRTCPSSFLLALALGLSPYGAVARTLVVHPGESIQDAVDQAEIARNNRPNPFGPSDPDALAQLPVGTGILNVGGDRVQIRGNAILQNNSFGVGLIGNPFVFFDPRIEPFVDGKTVRGNAILANGSAPDPDRPTTPGADIVFIPDVVVEGVTLIPDPDPSDNCFAQNLFGTDFPTGVTSAFACSE